MSHWAPKPLRPSPANNLFPMTESESIEKSDTPLQRQRRADGTPPTRTGLMCVRPPQPKLTLNGLSKSKKSEELPDEDLESIEKNEMTFEKAQQVVKSFMGR